MLFEANDVETYPTIKEIDTTPIYASDIQDRRVYLVVDNNRFKAANDEPLFTPLVNEIEAWARHSLTRNGFCDY